LVALALYRLLKDVNQNQAVLMVIWGGPLPAAVNFLNALNDVSAETIGTSSVAIWSLMVIDDKALKESGVRW